MPYIQRVSLQGGGRLNYGQAVLADQPMWYAPLQDPSGNPVDISGQAKNCTSNSGLTYLTGGCPIVSAPFGITLGTATSRAATTGVTSVATNNMTMEMWVNLGSLQADKWAFSYGSQVNGSGYRIDFRASGKFRVTLNNVANLADSTLVMATSTWYYLVAQRDAGTWKYFVNGVADNQAAGSSAPLTPATSIDIGNNGSAATPVTIAHLAIYDSVLSPSQIQNHYSARAS